MKAVSLITIPSGDGDINTQTEGLRHQGSIPLVLSSDSVASVVTVPEHLLYAMQGTTSFPPAG